MRPAHLSPARDPHPLLHLKPPTSPSPRRETHVIPFRTSPALWTSYIRTNPLRSHYYAPRVRTFSPCTFLLLPRHTSRIVLSCIPPCITVCPGTPLCIPTSTYRGARAAAALMLLSL